MLAILTCIQKLLTLYLALLCPCLQDYNVKWLYYYLLCYPFPKHCSCIVIHKYFIINTALYLLVWPSWAGLHVPPLWQPLSSCFERLILLVLFLWKLSKNTAIVWTKKFSLRLRKLDSHIPFSEYTSLLQQTGYRNYFRQKAQGSPCSIWLKPLLLLHLTFTT